MDPNANLARLRHLVHDMPNGEADHGDWAEICELVEALDDWLSNGGFLPQDWSKGR